MRPAVHMKHPDDAAGSVSPVTRTMFLRTALCRRKEGVAVLYVTTSPAAVTCWQCCARLAKTKERP